MSDAQHCFTVFIVDDSALMRERLTELLGTVPNLEVCGTASTVPAAIAAIKGGGVDAVILDIDLEGGSGIGVIREIKQAPIAPVILVLTIHPFSELGSYCLAAGADHYFEKGHSFDGVLRLLEDLSSRHAQKIPRTSV